MLVHPTFIMIFFIFILMILGDKYRKTFKIIALTFPIAACLFLMIGQEEHMYELYNLTLLWKYDDISKLVGAAFLLVILVFNLYALSQNNTKELLLGSAYGAMALFTILAQDFISMFVGIEIMMIISSAIIFIGGRKQSKKAAKKYFLTHLISSNLILIGIAHIMAQSQSVEIVPVSNLINNPLYSSSMIYAMFAGMIINIAAFPFSGWMVNYYKEAAPVGVLYLISFTTKVSIILLIKLFPGFEALKYVGALMILYAGFKAFFEDNIFSLLCYLSIIAMGVMVLGISLEATFAVACYLFIHIIYKALLGLSVVSSREEREQNQSWRSSKATVAIQKKMNSLLVRLPWTFCSIVMKTPLTISLLFAIALLANFPFSISLAAKLKISESFAGTLFYPLIILANLLTLIALPWKNWRQYVGYPSNSSLVLMLGFTILISIAAIIMGLVNYDFIEILKQLGVFVVAAIIVISLNQIRKVGKGFNLIDFVYEGCGYLYNKYLPDDKAEKNREDWNIAALEEQIINKISVFHNQQTAIFVVFLLFILMLLTLIAYSH
jgi:multicomponent Na+:H+ antiporter subunit D